MNKIFLILVCLTLFNFAGTPSGISLTNKIAPTDSADIFPTHNDLWGQGGFREVLNATARDAIPPARRTMGMVVYCTADSTTYQLRGDTTNASWQIYKLGKALPDSSIKSQRSVFADSSKNTYKSDTSIVSAYATKADSSRASHISDTALHSKDTVRASNKSDTVLKYINLYLGIHGTADTAIKAQRAVFSDSSKNSHKADTSIKSQRAVFADSGTNTHKSDTAIKSQHSIQADTVLKYINLYLGIHGTADTAIKTQRSVFSDSTPKAQHAIQATKADSATVVSNLFKIPTSTLADSAKGSHHLSGGNVLGDSANFHGSVIQKNGYIGIGTTAPLYQLSISGTNSVRNEIIGTNTGGTAGLYLRSNGNAGGTTIRDNNKDLEFFTSTTGQVVTIKDNGNVGIGTTTPTSKLQVVGLPTYATNAMAVAAGLTAGALYILTGTNALQVVQ